MSDSLKFQELILTDRHGQIGYSNIGITGFFGSPDPRFILDINVNGLNVMHHLTKKDLIGLKDTIQKALDHLEASHE